MDPSEDFLLMSGIQHFCFCRRQWALIHLEQNWADNYRTAEGTVLHENAHAEGTFETRGNLLIIRGLRVNSYSLRLTGQCDVVEFSRSDYEHGVILKGRQGYWAPLPIEYKRGRPKVTDVDKVQVCAQAIALEEMLSCPKIEKGACFYHETRRRDYFLLDEELRTETREIASKMQEYYQKKYTPKPKWSKSCNACSLKEICMPILGKKLSVDRYIAENALDD